MALLQIIGREGDVAGGDTELRMPEQPLERQHVAARPEILQRKPLPELMGMNVDSGPLPARLHNPVD